MGKNKAVLPGQLADIDLKLLRIFKTVVDCGGIVAAEDELNIATSTISNYLSDLEQRLDMRLCQRGRRGFLVTDQGAMVYLAIQELLTAIEQFQMKVRDTKERLVGNLNLVVAESLASYPESILQSVLSRFSKEAPDVFINLDMTVAEEVSRTVMDGRAMVGVSQLFKPTPTLDLIPLGSESLDLYCGIDHPLYSQKDSQISKEDIEQQKLVETPRLKPGQLLYPQSERGHIQASASNLEARAILIRTGSFIAYLPTQYVDLMGLGDVMRPLKPDCFSYSNSYYAMTSKNELSSPVTERFLEMLRAEALKHQGLK